jgi:hypothetical protein
MTEKYIGPVRPMFTIENEAPPKKKTERLVAGSNSNGVLVDISKQGMEINAYYTGFSEDVRYAVLRQPVVIPWEELDKMKGRIFSGRSKKLARKDRIESNVDKDYLNQLPVVTINSKQYYIDPDRRERRAVDKPEEVWRF